MIDLITRPGAWLLWQAAALPDTVVTKTVVVRGWFETATGVAMLVLALTVVVAAMFMAATAWWVWKSLKKARELLDRAYADIEPLRRHATSVAANLDNITTSIRKDVQQVNATIAAANRRLHQATELTETRLNEFN